MTKQESNTHNHLFECGNRRRPDTPKTHAQADRSLQLHTHNRKCFGERRAETLSLHSSTAIVSRYQPETVCDSLWEYSDGKCKEVTKKEL